jgi:hypothetical protein
MAQKSGNRKKRIKRVSRLTDFWTSLYFKIIVFRRLIEAGGRLELKVALLSRGTNQEW